MPKEKIVSLFGSVDIENMKLQLEWRASDSQKKIND